MSRQFRYNGQYNEIFATSYFSFLRGTSSPEEFIETAHKLAYRSIAITDRNSLAGVVRAHGTLRELKERTSALLDLLIGAAVEILPDEKAMTEKLPSDLRWLLVLHPTDVSAYGALSELLSVGKSRSEDGDCLLTIKDLEQFQASFCVTAIPPLPHPRILHQLHDTFRAFEMFLKDVNDIIKDSPLFSLALIHSYGHLSTLYEERVREISQRFSLPLIATNAPRYHHPSRKPLHDVVTCIREHTTIHEAGYLLATNGERSLKPPEEMYRLYRENSSRDRTQQKLPGLGHPFPLSQGWGSISVSPEGGWLPPSTLLVKGLPGEHGAYPPM